MNLPAHSANTALPRRKSYPVFTVLVVLFAVFLFLNISMSESGVSKVLPMETALRVILRHVPLVGSHVAPVPAYLDNIVWNARLPPRIRGGVDWDASGACRGCVSEFPAKPAG